LSIERKVVYWENPGKEHTEASLKIALEAAKERDIDTVLISSTTGYVAEKAVEVFKDSGLKLVIVTHARPEHVSKRQAVRSLHALMYLQEQ